MSPFALMTAVLVVLAVLVTNKHVIKSILCFSESNILSNILEILFTFRIPDFQCGLRDLYPTVAQTSDMNLTGYLLFLLQMTTVD